ncbi:MAG: preprotein translocase subunit SecG [Thermonemataceae bacterium]
MLYIIMGLILVLAVLLILVVLAQNSKGGGLSSQFGGSASQMIGVKKSSDLLEKVTWGFIVAMFVLTLSTNLFVGNSGQTSSSEEDLEGINANPTTEQPALPEQNQPQENE